MAEVTSSDFKKLIETQQETTRQLMSVEERAADDAKKAEITIFSSPFDQTAIDLLEDLNAPAYKIASFEAIDLPLIRYAASTGKPMIISTGMADEEEISEAIDTAQSSGCTDLAILHCVSGYPAPAEDYNLETMNFKNRYSNKSLDLGKGIASRQAPLPTLGNATTDGSKGQGAGDQQAA